MEIKNGQQSLTYASMVTLGVFGTFVALIAAMAPEREVMPDDPELATVIQETFPELTQALENPGEQIILYDDGFQDIYAHMLSNADVGDYLRLSSMGDAANLFNQHAQDGLYVRSMRCYEHNSETIDRFDCSFIIAEKGGIVSAGFEEHGAAPACLRVTYNATITPTEDGLYISTNPSRVRDYEHRINPESALHGHVDMSQFTEEDPHVGPISLNEITTSEHVYFHDSGLRTGAASLNSFSILLGEDQLSAEHVLARFSECIKGHEVPETIVEENVFEPH